MSFLDRVIHTCRIVMCTLALVGPLAAQFDLVEVNDVPGPEDPGITYTFAPVSAYLAEATGVAVADVNKDGWQDVMFFGTETEPNQLYIHAGDGTFTESAAAYGVSESSKRRGFGAFFDLENDGDLDLITCGYPGFPTFNFDLWSLYRNDGSPDYHFTNITASSGGFVLAPSAETTTRGNPGGVAIADYNRDGYLDVLTTFWHRNVTPADFLKDQFRLWKNVPNPNPDLGEPDYTPRQLVDATVEAGLVGAGNGWIWMPSFIDFDRDGWPDFHLNVEVGLDELRLNNGNGTFGPNIATDVGMNYNAARNMGNEMGVALGDYDNDGDIDTYHTNDYEVAVGTADAFYRNDSDLAQGGDGLAFTNIGPVTTDATTPFGIAWGTVFGDLDLDGDLDLLVARGMGNDEKQNKVWRNEYPALASDGVSIALQDVSANCPEFTAVGVTRALVAFDYDHDGDLDVVTTRSGAIPPAPTDNMRAGFFKNTLTTTDAHLQLDLEEAGGSLNTVGARIFVRTGGVGGSVQMQEVKAGSSFLGQEPYRLHFGLGAAPADWIAIRWFDGEITVLRDEGEAPLEGFLAASHEAEVDTGDVNGDDVVDCLDVETLNVGLFAPATVDAMVPDWPWRIVADVDGNGHVEKLDFALLRALVPDTFCGVGGGLAGTHGVPLLVGSGPLLPLTLLSLDLTSVLENSSTYAVIGFSLLDQPFKGGVLVPAPNIVLGPFPTGLAGSLSLPGLWPTGIPGGFQIHFQFWTADDAAIKNFSASNGVTTLVP